MNNLKSRQDVKAFFNEHEESLSIPTARLPAIRKQFEYFAEPSENDVDESLVENLTQASKPAGELASRMIEIMEEEKNATLTAHTQDDLQIVSDVDCEAGTNADTEPQPSDDMSPDAENAVVETSGAVDVTDDKIEEIPLSELEAYEVIPVRAKQDKAAINEYTDSYKNGNSLPPVTVIETPLGGRILADGGNRIAAMKKAGLRKCKILIKHGDWNAAIKFALTANASHGVRRSNEDKRLCAELAIKQFSNTEARKIAEMCSVSHTFINNIINKPAKAKGANAAVMTDVSEKDVVDERNPEKNVEAAPDVDAEKDIQAAASESDLEQESPKESEEEDDEQLIIKTLEQLRSKLSEPEKYESIITNAINDVKALNKQPANDPAQMPLFS